MPMTDIMNEQRQDQFCQRDGFPLVNIDGERYCSVEYADGLIGGQKVIGVAAAGDHIELLFANGYLIPLTCPCCDGPLHLTEYTLPDIRTLFNGRSLEGFRHGEWIGEGTPPGRHPIFALQFSGEEERDERTLEVGLASVTAIRRQKKETG